MMVMMMMMMMMMMMIGIYQPADDKPSLKGAWSCHLSYVNFSGHQPCLWNDWS